MATLQNIGKLKYRGKDGQWHPLPVVVQDAGSGVSTISGKGAPTSETQGKVNQLYRDEDTQRLYICTATEGGYTWAEVFGGGSVDIDATLTQVGQAADAKATGDAISSLSEAIAELQNKTPSDVSGLTVGQIQALDGMFKIASYTEDPTAAYSAFKAAFGIEGGGDVKPDEPETPTKTLTSISAVYSGADVAVGTALNDLTGIVVTATYSDGSTENVTGYTLSGEIAEGSNTITVSYSGKTTTFTVTGVAESGAELITDGLQAYFDLRNSNGSLGNNSTGYYIDATQGNGRMYGWYTMNAGNEYGAKIGKTEYCAGTTYTRHDFGTEFTWFVKSYCDVHATLWGFDKYISPVNDGANLIGTYNKTDDSTATTETAHFPKFVGYQTSTIRVSGTSLRIYANGELKLEADGSAIDSFESWYSYLKIGDSWTHQATQHCNTACLFYNRALSDVEIVETLEYLKTLEVA